MRGEGGGSEGRGEGEGGERGGQTVAEGDRARASLAVLLGKSLVDVHFCQKEVHLVGAVLTRHRYQMWGGIGCEGGSGCGAVLDVGRY